MNGLVFSIAAGILGLSIGFSIGWSGFSNYITGICDTDNMIVKKKDFVELRFTCEVVHKESK